MRKASWCYHVAGVWMGAFLYADDLSFLAPTRSILASMLALVESYGGNLNLIFSTQDPKQCKSFLIFFMVPARRVVYPTPLVLN